jgi:5'-nucleotidase
MIHPRRHRVVLAVVLLLVACSAPLGPLGGPAPPEARITLLQINDVYTLEPVDDGRRGGFARLATLVKRIRRENPATVLALGGDVISPSVASTLLKGEQMIGGLNALGLDLAALGNHEFDFGPTILAQRMRESAFTWLAANVLDRRTGRPFGGARSDVLVTLGGVRVAVYGLTTPDSARTSSPGPDVEFRDPITTARALTTELKGRGAQVLVAVTHQEMGNDRALAAAPGVELDVILGGHEHEPLIAEEGRTLITKGGADARYLVQVDLWIGGDGRLRERSWAFHEVSERLAPDPDMAAIVRAYGERADRELGVEVGRTAVPLEGRRSHLRTEETNLGNFITDAMRAQARTDVALINGGGIRSDRVIPPGPLTRRDLAAMSPFGNVVMTLELTGRVLREVLEQALPQREREAGGFLQVSGLAVTFDPARPVGQRIVTITVNGAPLDPDTTYSAAVVDYIGHGKDGLDAFLKGRVLVDAMNGPLIADILLKAVTTQGTIAPALDGRLRPIAR